MKRGFDVSHSVHFTEKNRPKLKKPCSGQFFENRTKFLAKIPTTYTGKNTKTLKNPKKIEQSFLKNRTKNRTKFSEKKNFENKCF